MVEIADSQQQEEQQLAITGVYIPGEVAFNDELNRTDYMVWWIIHSLCARNGYCWATNQFIAGKLKVTTTTVSLSIKRLKNLKYIKIKSSNKYNSRSRIIEIDPEYIALHHHYVVEYNQKNVQTDQDSPFKKTYRQPLRKLKIDNNIDNNREDSFSKEKELEDSDESSSPPLIIKRVNKQAFKKKRLFHQDNKLTADQKKIFVTWQNCGDPFTKHNQSGKKWQQIMDAIKKVSRRHDQRDIRRAIKDFHWLLTSKNTVIDFRKPSLNDFLVPNHMIARANGRDATDWLSECLKGRDYLREKYGKFIKDQHPKVTEKLRDLWEDEFTEDISIQDDNNFRRAAKKIVSFIDMHYNDIEMGSGTLDHPANFVKWVYKALLDNKGHIKKKIHTGWLIQQFFYDDILPKYLQEKGYM